MQIVATQGARRYGYPGADLQVHPCAIRVDLVPDLAVLQGSEKRGLAIILHGCKGRDRHGGRAAGKYLQETRLTVRLHRRLHSLRCNL